MGPVGYLTVFGHSSCHASCVCFNLAPSVIRLLFLLLVSSASNMKNDQRVVTASVTIKTRENG